MLPKPKKTRLAYLSDDLYRSFVIISKSFILLPVICVQLVVATLVRTGFVVASIMTHSNSYITGGVELDFEFHKAIQKRATFICSVNFLAGDRKIGIEDQLFCL